MKAISRRQFLFLSLGSLGLAASSALLKAPSLARAIGRPPETVQLRNAYGASAYGKGSYGSATTGLRK